MHFSFVYVRYRFMRHRFKKIFPVKTWRHVFKTSSRRLQDQHMFAGIGNRDNFELGIFG